MVFVCESVCVHSRSIKALPDCVSRHSLSPLQVAGGNVSLICCRYCLSMSGQRVTCCVFITEPKKRQCKVLFEYVPQNEDELELKIGDIIDITEEVSSFCLLYLIS